MFSLVPLLVFFVFLVGIRYKRETSASRVLPYITWGDYHLKHKSKEFIIDTPSITFWRVVSPRLVRCHLGAPVQIVELKQGVCKGKEIAYFVKIYSSEASPSWAMAMVG